MEEDRGNAVGVDVAAADFEQFAANLFPVYPSPLLKFHAEDRQLLPRFADADQGGAEDIGMGVEYGLSRDGE